MACLTAALQCNASHHGLFLRRSECQWSSRLWIILKCATLSKTDFSIDPVLAEGVLTSRACSERMCLMTRNPAWICVRRRLGS
mmetsp:Transcript_19356/g.60755  ORF Transcript_19356/g.60755 Transcript_19356/m.60755 type:complete len:83 (-) Transcript_19356:67-315(-)